MTETQLVFPEVQRTVRPPVLPPRRGRPAEKIPEPFTPGPRGCRKDSYERIRPHCLRLRSVLYRALREAEAEGLTDEQLENVTGIAGNSLRPQRLQLIALGLASDSGLRRQTLSGRWATVWIAKPVVSGAEEVEP